MFFNCSALETIPELHATTLASSCYGLMFVGCNSLIDLDEFVLPGTEDPGQTSSYEAGCYQAMFNNCQNLRIAPTVLIENCSLHDGQTTGTIHIMYGRCSSLISAPFPNLLSSDVMAQKAVLSTNNDVVIYCADGIFRPYA